MTFNTRADRTISLLQQSLVLGSAGGQGSDHEQELKAVVTNNIFACCRLEQKEVRVIDGSWYLPAAGEPPHAA